MECGELAGEFGCGRLQQASARSRCPLSRPFQTHTSEHAHTKLKRRWEIGSVGVDVGVDVSDDDAFPACVSLPCPRPLPLCFFSLGRLAQCCQSCCSTIVSANLKLLALAVCPHLPRCCFPFLLYPFNLGACCCLPRTRACCCLPRTRAYVRRFPPPIPLRCSPPPCSPLPLSFSLSPSPSSLPLLVTFSPARISSDGAGMDIRRERDTHTHTLSLTRTYDAGDGAGMDKVVTSLLLKTKKVLPVLSPRPPPV